MSEYYGVQRSEDYLTHYGIKGMKWGVRKAKESGNERKLDRQYKKAAKKLAKLNERANIEAQTARANKLNKIAKVSGKIGTAGASLAVAGTGTNHTLHYINSLHKKVTQNELDKLSKKADDTLNEYQLEWKYYNKNDPKYLSDATYRKKIDDDLIRRHTEAQNAIQAERTKVRNDFNKAKDARKTAADIGKYVGYAGAGVGALGLGTAAITKAKAHAAKKRITAEGHAKAVANRDAWQKEMKSAFKGTSYANLPPYAKKKVKHSDLEDPNSLAHYGIKGMKWGVRKAIYNQNDRALERHYRKAAKKLAKLEDIGNNPAKYAAKSAAYGAAAVGTGTTIGNDKILNRLGSIVLPINKAKMTTNTMNNTLYLSQLKKDRSNVVKGLKIAATAGLAAKSAQNAYRAVNAKKYRAKANEFRNAMNESFAGTKYEGLNGLPLPKKSRVRRKSK